MDVGYRVSKNFWRMWLSVLIALVVTGGLLFFKMYKENINSIEEMGNRIFSYNLGFVALGCIMMILLIEKPTLDRMKYTALGFYNRVADGRGGIFSLIISSCLFCFWGIFSLIVLPYTIVNTIVQYIVYLICKLCKKKMTDTKAMITSVVMIVGPIVILFIFSFVIFMFQEVGYIWKDFLG